MGKASNLLARYTESTAQINIEQSLDLLKSKMSSRQYQAVPVMLSSQPKKITEALYEISGKLISGDQDVDLDDLVQVLETNARALSGGTKEKEAADRKAGYDKAATNSIRKSLLAQGIKPLS